MARWEDQEGEEVFDDALEEVVFAMSKLMEEYS